MSITAFHGEHACLSNFAASPVEHAFQVAKTHS
jgi:hypothetical protein